MGTGKTSAVISYINSHPNNRFIYISPFLDEAKRIKQWCPKARFIEPNNINDEFGHKKLQHAKSLIELGRNIASTHQLFRNYTPEMLELIRGREYTLIIDENLDSISELGITKTDMQVLIDAGYAERIDGNFQLTNKQYDGEFFTRVVEAMRFGKVCETNDGDATIFHWIINSELITSFKDVFICTYMFESNSLHHLLKIDNIPYEYIGVVKDDDGGYSFGECPSYTPEFASGLKDRIHILDNDKLNSIGDDYHALSVNWFGKDKGNVEKLRKHIYNYFTNLAPVKDARKRLWATYNNYYRALRGNGYSNNFLTFNAKSTNEYRDRDVLVYAVNIFPPTAIKLFFRQHGVEINDNQYALSTMVQWIWRSAIRDGGDVYIYIPSRRMRELLINWIGSFDNIGGINGKVL